jgi:ATP-binding cassette subfamily B protein
MKIVRQLDEMDCGPTCLKMVLESYNQNGSINRLRQLCGVSRTGVTMKNLSIAAEYFGLRTEVVKISYNKRNGIPGIINLNLPAIAHYNQNHFVVVYKINRRHVWIADPAHGKIKLTKEQFEKSWCSDGDKGMKFPQNLGQVQ